MAGLKFEASSFSAGTLQEPAQEHSLLDLNPGMGEPAAEARGEIPKAAAYGILAALFFMKVLHEGSAQSIELANITKRLVRAPLTYWCLQIASEDSAFHQSPAMLPRLTVFDPHDCFFQPLKDEGCCILLFFEQQETSDRIAPVPLPGE